MTRALIAALLLCGLSNPAAAFDPRQHRAPVAGQPTQVMVLGTPHLSEMDKSFDPATLSLLLDRLAAWKPDRIAVEGVSGQQCDMLRRYKALIPDVAEQYCWDNGPALAASGMDMPAALAEIDKRLANWPAQPTPAERRQLALLFLAAGDRASALVQWLRLPSPERRAADGLTPELAKVLDASIGRRNENYAIAAALATRLGHERLWLMDDHSSDYIVAEPGEAFGKAMEKIWNNPAGEARIAAGKAAQAAATSPAATLAMYRHYNDPAEAERAFTGDFGAAMANATPQQYGRRYLAWWETRNLRMAANIREAAAAIPGGRVLVLAGASHKGYLDAYLDMMHDMKVANSIEILQ